MMWLVVYKQFYYPSVFECSTEEEAKSLYSKIKKKKFKENNDSLEAKLYITKIEDSIGTYDSCVDWYLDIDEEDDKT